MNGSFLSGKEVVEAQVDKEKGGGGACCDWYERSWPVLSPLQGPVWHLPHIRARSASEEGREPVPLARLGLWHQRGPFAPAGWRWGTSSDTGKPQGWEAEFCPNFLAEFCQLPGLDSWGL